MSRRHKPADAENREWTAADFKQAKRPGEALPEDVLAAFPRPRGAQKAPRKIAVSIRLSPEVVAHFKATGKGWQARSDEAVKRAAGV